MLTDRKPSPPTLLLWAELGAKLRSDRPCQSQIDALKKFASFGRDLQTVKSKVISPLALKAIATAGQRLAINRDEKIRSLLEEWNRRLNPIRDPLTLNFGMNRWLSSDREEAYSDWIAWILREIGRRHAERLLLGTETVHMDDYCETSREVWVPEGHDGHAGRLDCVVNFADTIIVLELKTGSAVSADTAKHEGYAKWLKERTERRRVALLLATEVNETDKFGFRPMAWDKFTKGLRNLLPYLIAENKVLLACIVASFIGAVEQNILGFPAIDADLHTSLLATGTDRLIKYLEQ